MIKILSIFKLVHADTIYIILNNINSVMGFNSLINNYLKYWNIDINI